MQAAAARSTNASKQLRGKSGSGGLRRSDSVLSSKYDLSSSTLEHQLPTTKEAWGYASEEQKGGLQLQMRPLESTLTSFGPVASGDSYSLRDIANEDTDVERKAARGADHTNHRGVKSPQGTSPPVMAMDADAHPSQPERTGDKDIMKASTDSYLERIKAATTTVKSLQKERNSMMGLEKQPPWTTSNKFQSVVGVVIVLNAVCLGMEADLGLYHPNVFLALEHIFAALFLIELLLHFWVEGVIAYFKDSANWLDFSLVVMSISDVWIIQQIGVDADMRLMSLMRLIRLARLARLLRLVRMFKELTLIIEGFVSGARALAWATLFLLIMVYIFAIFARLQIGARYICGDGETEVQETETCPAEAGGGQPGFLYEFNPEIGNQASLFGSIGHTVLTLFICLSEGCGVEVVHPTVRKSPVLSVFWLLFSLVTTFGVLNLIIGLFCENSMRIALNTEREIMRNQEDERREKLEALRIAFQRMDQDGTGDISREEFTQAIAENEEVIDSMTALGLDEEKDLFDVIDADHSGALEFNEFFDGVTLIMKGQEPALAKDMVATYLRVNSLHKAQERLEKEVQQIRDEQVDTRKSLDRIERLLSDIASVSTPAAGTASQSLYDDV